jgi:NAD(P)-dependent dehydrogenase (short-subunit alcohol dehydrogenase family)
MSKWVLVTGAAKRIGHAIALELAEHDWNVIVHYNKSVEDAEQTAKEIEKMGHKARAVPCNFTNKKQTENFIPSLVKESGPLAALVNNASLFEPDARAPGGHDHKTINVEAPMILSEAFRKQVPPGASGAIVNILDGCVPEIGFAAYGESKKALRAMTIEMARRFAPSVRVNGVAAGPVLQGQRQSPEHFKKLVEATLLKTAITPQAVAAAVRFLLENPSISGENLHIDGGIRLRNTATLARAAS